MRYRKEADKVEVPPGAGTAGFLETIKQLLELRGIDNIHISAKGLVEWERWVPKDGPEVEPFGIDLSTFTPHDAMRRGLMKEIVFVPEENAAETICKCFVAARVDGVVPICFATGPNTLLWKWFARKTAVTASLPQDEFFGLPLRRDSGVPNEALVMFAGYERTAQLVDSTHVYKIPLVLQ